MELKQGGGIFFFVLQKEIDAQVLEDKGADTESDEQETDIS